MSRRGVQQTEGGRKLRFLVTSTSDDAAIFLQPSFVYTKGRVFRLIMIGVTNIEAYRLQAWGSEFTFMV